MHNWFAARVNEKKKDFESAVIHDRSYSKRHLLGSLYCNLQACRSPSATLPPKQHSNLPDFCFLQLTQLSTRKY